MIKRYEKSRMVRASVPNLLLPVRDTYWQVSFGIFTVTLRMNGVIPPVPEAFLGQ